MSPFDEMLAEELSDTLAADQKARKPLADRMAEKDPELFLRIRMACAYGSASMDLNQHAANIMADVLAARRQPRPVYGHLAKARR